VCHFIRVEIVLQGSTYFVVFSDTEQLPPPFRIDNLSLLPITFNQVGIYIHKWMDFPVSFRTLFILS